MIQPSTKNTTHLLWRFELNAHAERVFLHIEQPDGSSSWHEMARLDDNGWTMEQKLDPRGCRFNYYILDGGTLINCGAEGLRIEPALRIHNQPAAAAAADNNEATRV